MTPRAEMTAALGAVAVGGLLALVAAGQPRTTSPGSAGDAGTPGAAALGLVLLAGAAVVLLVRARVRRVVGVVLVAASAAVVAAYLAPADVLGDNVYVIADPAAPAGSVSVGRAVWFWLGVTGGAVAAAGSLATVLRAGRWPEPGRRQERAPRRSTDPWEALDRGEDPTT
jgi:hypothetical protein